MSGGGWTLIIKADGKKQTFSYYGNIWNNKLTLNEYSTNMLMKQHKNAGFYSITFNEIKLAFNNTNYNDNYCNKDENFNSMFSC